MSESQETVVASVDLPNGNLAEVLATPSQSFPGSYDTNVEVFDKSGNLLNTYNLVSGGYSQAFDWKIVSSPTGSFLIYYTGPGYIQDNLFDSSGATLAAGIFQYHDIVVGDFAIANKDGGFTFSYATESDSGQPFLGPVYSDITSNANGTSAQIIQNNAYLNGYGSMDVTQRFDGNGYATSVMTDYGSFGGNGWSFSYQYEDGSIYHVSGTNLLTGQSFSIEPDYAAGFGIQETIIALSGNYTVTHYDTSGQAYEIDSIYDDPAKGLIGTKLVYNDDGSKTLTTLDDTETVATTYADGTKSPSEKSF